MLAGVSPKSIPPDSALAQPRGALNTSLAKEGRQYHSSLTFPRSGRK